MVEEGERASPVLEVDINEPLKPEDRVSVYLTTQVRSEIRIPLLIEKLTMKEFSLLKTKLEDVRQRKGFNHTEALEYLTHHYYVIDDMSIGVLDDGVPDLLKREPTIYSLDLKSKIPAIPKQSVFRLWTIADLVRFWDELGWTFYELPEEHPENLPGKWSYKTIPPQWFPLKHTDIASHDNRVPYMVNPSVLPQFLKDFYVGY